MLPAIVFLNALWILQTAAEQAADAAAKQDQGFVVYMLPYLVLGITVVLGTQVFRGTDTGVVPCKFLGSDVVYWTTTKREGEAEASSTAGTAVGAPAATGNKKKVRKLQQQQQQGLSAAQGSLLQAGYLYPDLLALLEFTEEFDYLLRFIFVVVVNIGAALLFRFFLTPSMPYHAVNVLVSGFGYLCLTLYKVEWAHVIIGKDEKLYMACAGALGTVVAFCLLVWVSPGIMAFDMAAATEELTSRIAAVARDKVKTLPADQLQPVKDATVMGGVLALIAGGLAGLLMAPGIRYGRLLQDFLKPPSWAAGFKPKLADKVVAQAGFALQLLLTPLWVTSMTDVLRLPATGLAILRGVLMLLVAVTQAWTLPRLLQAFMYSTPLHAHVVTRNPAVADDIKVKTVKKVTQVTLSQASKVCVQLIVLPTLMLSSGLAYLLLAFPSPLAATSPFAKESDKKPSAMMMSIAGFVGWWGSTVYILWASLGTILSRLSSAALSG